MTGHGFDSRLIHLPEGKLLVCLNDFVRVTVGDATVFHGSNLDVLPFMADNSVDSIVCDPPYELGFMGKKWDSSGIAYSVELWRECLRVLKPGGHLLAFGGSRTWHRLAVAVEDAGFDVRDSIAWLYGSGFPKSLDIAKAIQKAEGIQPIGFKENENGHFYGSGQYNATPRQLFMPELEGEAEKWAGWGTALKPAFEPVVVARKPLVGTVAENVLAWGVGGLNIDASRIGTEGGTQGATNGPSNGILGDGLNGAFGKPVVGLGRWPANIILDEYTAGLLDEQSGETKSLGHNRPQATKWGFGVNADNSKQYDYETGQTGYTDSGGASRFFYVAKANKRDRNEGLDELSNKIINEITPPGSKGANSPRAGAGRNGATKNFHPTVKPTDLMRYLIKLVTPAGGIVLDPFTGSGSTGKAALLDGYRFIGIELTEEYLPIIEGRLRWATTTREKELLAAEANKQETLF